ncbi:MAG: UDP-N-acetylmuramate dehydrogenase [Holosporales bacterium]|jgi:UDP-N-acetylmuramate dehydrogenase|nr:UDP-N-acetylmuramate dehydrogenase [Holosporales bacterium]
MVTQNTEHGEYYFDVPLLDFSSIKTGGVCDVLFYPKDEDDLINFLCNNHPSKPVICLGNMSNTLVLDGGIRGCVVNLSKFMTNISFNKTYVNVQAGASLNTFIIDCVSRNISCCEKLYCIPGTIGGALFMNAGIPGFEISDVLIEIRGVDHHGKTYNFKRHELNMEYRNGNIRKDFIITSATLKTTPSDKDKLELILNEILEKRRRTQPIGCQTLGCTFKNPDGYKAWKLIMDAGCGGMSVGGACISDIHMNFFINSGGATSLDFIHLIKLVKDRVFQETGIMLEEEIIIMGEED